MSAFFVVLVSCLLFNGVFSKPEEDAITNLPGLNYNINFEHFSGYLDAGEGNMLHYWYTESQSNPVTDPLILWLNGGPGCSSLEGLLTELGPYFVNKDGSELVENPYAWNTFANVLYLESPACVGFSYDDNGTCGASDDGTAEQNYNALKSFDAKFPDLVANGNEFYITGESYAGVYIPTLAKRVWDGQDSFPINFTGFAIGNGLLSYRSNTDSLMFYGYYHALLGQDLWDNLISRCCVNGIESADNCDFFQDLSAGCEESVLHAEQIMYYGGLDVYNLYADCLHPEEAVRSEGVSRSQMDMRNLMWLRKDQHDARRESREDPPCTDSTATRNWLNDPAVRAAIHIPDEVQDWDICSTVVNNRYLRQYYNMHDSLIYLNDKVRGLIYNGDVDMACNVIGNTWDVEALELTQTLGWEKWIDSNEQVNGYLKKFTNLDFVTIRGSGHMVPTDKPIPALQMIKAFINQTPY